MAQTQSGTLHWTCSSVPATAPPYTLAAHIQCAGGQARKFIAIANSSDITQVVQLGLDLQSSFTNKVQSYVDATTGNQALSTVAINTTGGYSHCIAVVASTTDRHAFKDGANKGIQTGVQSNPTGLNEILVSGRSSDFQFGIGGQIAHGALWTRALSDNEAAYLGAGGSPRALKGTVAYWKFHSGDTTVHDEIGTYDLTPSATMGAGTTDPNIETFFVGTAIAAQSYPIGTAITSINLAAGGGLFDDVTSPFTVTLQQLGTATTPATTSSTLSSVRELPLNTTTGISVNGFVKVTSGGNWTRVLYVNASTNTIVVDADQSYSSGAQIYYAAASPLSIGGLGMTSNVFGGTPSGSPATFNNCVFCATCNANGALLAYSNLFNITLTGGGGGGTGVVTSRYFGGGFQGG